MSGKTKDELTLNNAQCPPYAKRRRKRNTWTHPYRKKQASVHNSANTWSHKRKQNKTETPKLTGGIEHSDYKLMNRRWRGWRERREPHDQNPRPTEINSESGNRTLRIVSVNPDSLTTAESMLRMAEILLRNKIHLDAIQETHIPYGPNYVTDGYRIIASSEKWHKPPATRPVNRRRGNINTWQDIA